MDIIHQHYSDFIHLTCIHLCVLVCVNFVICKLICCLHDIVALLLFIRILLQQLPHHLTLMRRDFDSFEKLEGQEGNVLINL